MKFLDIQAAIGAAILVLSLSCDAKHGHRLSHMDVLGKRHHHSHRRLEASPKAEAIEGDENELKKRGSCAFPTNAGLVAVTPGSTNAGWAMSPDQACTPGSYCPYACPAGQVMAQWDPSATSYTYPQSMNGGLYCDHNGQISKPFPNKDYCVDGSGAVGVKNNAGSSVAFCQTVLPGNEAMLIPTHVDSWAQLAVPDPSYWCSTAAHYYINPPGVSTSDGCIWGDGSKAIGNWSPYVAGANTDNSGNTFVKIGWNPIWTGCDLSKTTPSFGIKVSCSGSGCNGLPCSIDPSVNGVGGVTSSDQASGAGGANFCVATVPKGQTANIEVFTSGNSNSGSSSSGSSSQKAASSSSSSPAPSSTQSPTSSSTSSKPSSTSTTSSTPSSTSTTSKASTTSSSSLSSTSTSSSSSSSSSSSFSSSSLSTSSSSVLSSSSASSTSSSVVLSVNTTSAYPTASNSPHILFENATVTPAGTGGSQKANNTALSTVPSPTSASKKSGAETTLVAGSVIFFSAVFTIASAYL